MAASQQQYCLCGQSNENSNFMIQCDVCKDWFHGKCVHVKEYESYDIEKFHCPRCQPMCGASVLKERRNWHRHDYADSQANEKAVESGTPVFIRELKTRFFPSAEECMLHVRGQQLSLPYFVQNGFDRPILAPSKEGLGLAMPPDTFTVNDIMDYVGEDFSLDAIDVGRQQDIKMTMKEWVTYYNSPERDKIYNVISLEFSKTRLSQLVRPPSIIQKLSWVENYWPEWTEGDQGNPERPLVMKYCLMGTEDSYTDFHIDFGGTSVWYHVLQGEKVFFLVPPTALNLSLYEEWLSSPKQSETFFGDQTSQCYRLVLERGQTLFIPSGWIHAVLTTMDSLVFGGNFLCSINIPMQLQVREIDERTKTPAKYKFPSFEATHWFSAPYIAQQLKDFNEGNRRPPNHLVTGAKALLAALKAWSQEKEKSKQTSIPKGIVPIRVIKQVAREVRAAEKLLTCKPVKGEGKKATAVKQPVGRPRRVKVSAVDSAKTKVEPGVGDVNGTHKGESILEPSVYDFVDSEEDSLVVDENPVRQRRPAPTPKPSPLLGSSSNNNNNNSSSQISSFKQRMSARSTKTPGSTPAVTTPPPVAVNLLTNTSATPVMTSKGNRRIPPSEAAMKIKLTFNGAEDSKGEALQQPQPTKNGTLDDLLLAVDYAGQDSTRVSLEDDLRTKAPNELTEHFEFAIPSSSSGRTSPSTREAIAGMLSMSKSAFTFAEEPSSGGTSQQSPHGNSSLCDSRLLGLSLLAGSRGSGGDPASGLMPAPPPFTGMSPALRAGRKRNISPSPEDDFEASLQNCHQDKDFIYLGLDVSDDEMHVFKPRGRGKRDESWNPTARVNISCPKPERPVREGARREAVESGLAAAAAKLADMPAAKRPYHRKKLSSASSNKLSKEGTPAAATVATTTTPTTPGSSPATNTGSSLLQSKKPRKGFATAKQRLGKILKIHKMIY